MCFVDIIGQDPMSMTVTDRDSPRRSVLNFARGGDCEKDADVTLGIENQNFNPLYDVIIIRRFERKHTNERWALVQVPYL